LSATTVLVVDDDVNAREAYAEYLRLNGFEVVTAGDGLEALEIARSALPDVVLLDAELPGIEGWRVLEELKADPRTRAIPVVLLTGHTLPADYARARACGAEALIAKPCVPDELVRRLKSVVHPPRA
jgi:two-component system cell cycle response regulator DivK